MKEWLKNYFTWGHTLGWIFTALLMVFVAIPVYRNVEAVMEEKGWHTILLDLITPSKVEEQVVDSADPFSIDIWYWMAVSFFAGATSFFWLTEGARLIGKGAKWFWNVISWESYSGAKLLRVMVALCPVSIYYKTSFQSESLASDMEQAWFGVNHSSVYHFYLILRNDSNSALNGLKVAITRLDPLPIQIHLPIQLEFEDEEQKNHLHSHEEKRISFIERDMKGSGDILGFHARGGAVHYIYNTGDLTRSDEHYNEVIRLQGATFQVEITVYADGYSGKEFHTTVRVNDDEQVEIGSIKNSKQ